MRLPVVLFTMASLSACGAVSTQQASMGRGQAPMAPDQGLMDPDMARQKQALLDADVIMQGMAQARNRAAELARSSR